MKIKPIKPTREFRYKRSGDKSLKEVLKIVKSIRKEMDDLKIPYYTPRKDGRVL